MPYSCVDGNVGLTEAKKKQKVEKKSIVVSSTKGEILSASVILLYRSQ